jgi:hypothetical protein
MSVTAALGTGNGSGPLSVTESGPVRTAVSDLSGPESGRGSGPEEWLSVTEAAARAKVQERSLRRWIARGVVVSDVTPDGRRRVLASSLPGPDSASDRDLTVGTPVSDLGQVTGPDSGQRC